MPFRHFFPLLLLALTLPLCAAANAQLPGPLPPIPGLKKAEALNYPDKSNLSFTSSGFEYTLRVKGRRVKRDGDRAITNSAELTASLTSVRDSKGLQRVDRLHGKFVSQLATENQATSATTKFSYDHTDNVPGKEEGSKPVNLSKRLGVANFAAPTWKIVNFPTTTTVVVKTEHDTETMTMDQDCCFDIRIPDLASTGTAFAAACQEVERLGHDCRMPLAGNVGPATFEAPFKGSSAHGTFTLNVEALVSPHWINVNTIEANRYMKIMGSNNYDDGSSVSMFTGTLTINWWIGARPPKAKLALEPEDADVYRLWLPTPEAQQGVDFSTHGYESEPLGITARLEPATEKEIQPRRRLDFYLTDVSKNCGRCGNFPRSFAADDDLRFAVKQTDPDITTDPADPRHAYTTKPVEEASVNIEALDTGAYGRLEVRCDDLSLVGEHKPTGQQFISIPRDDDENGVADAWEKQMVGGQAQAADWDEDADPAGHATNGDGIGLYHEYRGFVVRTDDGQRQFKRLSPRRKDLFIIDAGNIFDLSAWAVASGIMAHKLDESLVKGGGDGKSSRIANYTAEEGPDVYAVRVKAVPGLADPEMGTEEGVLGYCASDGSGPRSVTHLNVFPDRHRRFIKLVRAYLQRAVARPRGAEGQALQQAGMPPHLWQDALDHLDPARQEQLAKQCIRSTAIHEVGHACSIPGHLDENGDEAPVGDPSCPMRYSDKADDLRYIVLQTIFKPDATLQSTFSCFCRQGDNCWSHISLR